MSEASIEEQIQASGASASRIVPADLDAAIHGIDYHVFAGTTVTVCCLTLDNVFTTIGHSACADPANFNETIGREIAFKNAREQIWSLLGFRLRDRLKQHVNAAGEQA